jgi:hypothetical protein
LFATTLRTHFSLIILITTFDLFVPRLVFSASTAISYQQFAILLGLSCSVSLVPGNR